MSNPFAVVYACWLAIVLVWTAGFLGNKRTERVPFSGEQDAINMILLVGLGLLVSGVVSADASLSALGWIGAGVTVVGTAFSVWARRSIGKNWSGAKITLKERHELVTRGAYGVVRHPIYTGLLTVAYGSLLLAPSPVAGLGFLLILAGFLLRVRREESLMAERFPSAWPAYSARAKKLVPLIW